jgi:hypothetical protein
MKASLFLLCLAAAAVDLNAQTSSRYRPQPAPVRDRQSMVSSELQCLQATTEGLDRTFDDHLRRNRQRPTAAELELSEALHELASDVRHFIKDVQSGAQISHVYRTFHALEYSMQEAWAVSTEAGYGRSLEAWLSDADNHIGQLADCGFRNPRLQPVRIESGYGRSSGRVQQNDYRFAPPPSPYDSRSLPPGGQGAPGSRPGEVRIDLGDALRRLFGNKNR